MVNILIAEDDQEIVDILKLYIEDDETSIIIAANGNEAVEKFDDTIDLCLIDIMMPEMDGYQLMKHIRHVSNVPIIIISAKTSSQDKILGLNIGADDYIEKPFDPLEVVARVKAQLRRYNKLGASKEIIHNPIIKVGELELNTDDVVLTKNNEVVEITPVEYKILKLLMKSPGRVFTKSQIYTELHGEYFESDENTLMAHISKIRSKIEDDNKHPRYIKTIRGLGYKIEQE